MCEMLIQVGAQVIGNDATITFSGTYGAFELNTMMPVAAHNLLQAIDLLTNASRVFARRCVEGLGADIPLTSAVESEWTEEKRKR